MMTFEFVNPKLFKNYKGRYFRLGGFGILDGLKGKPAKADFYEILDTTERGILLRGRCQRKHSLLPTDRFNQTCQVITKAEYSTLPTY